MKIVTNIPPDVLRDVAVERLHLKDIARLDSAVCCNGLRISFLQQLYGNTHRYYQYNRYSDGLEDWVTLKLPLECQVYFLRYAIKSLRKEARPMRYEELGDLEGGEDMFGGGPHRDY
jgi:hypothetical protein